MSNIKGRYLWKKSIRNGFLAGHARIQLIVKQRLGRTIQLKKLWCLRMRPKQTKQTKISRRDLIQKMKDYCKNKSKKGDTVNWNNIWNWKAWEVIPSPKCKHALQLCPDPVAGCNSLHPWMFHTGLHEKRNQTWNTVMGLIGLLSLSLLWLTSDQVSNYPAKLWSTQRRFGVDFWVHADREDRSGTDAC